LDVADGEVNTSGNNSEKIYSDFEVQLSYAEKLGLSRDELINMLLKTEPYASNEELIAKYSNRQEDK
jgi:hypothetical protein